MAQQVNVFMENKPGRIHSIVKVLAENGVNMRALVIQDRGQFGMLKLLVSDPHKANLALNKAGFACALKPILAVVVDDKPGGLSRLTEFFLTNNVNISDSYGFVLAPGRSAVYCAELDDVSGVAKMVERQGFRVLEDSELYEL